MLLILLFGIAYVAIQQPGVQTKVAQKAADYLSRTIDHEVTVGSVDIEFFSNVILEQVRVLDYKDKEMFYVGRIEADISAFSIFHPNTLSIGTLVLQEPRANLVQYAGSDTLNLSTFIRSLSELIVKDTTKPSQPFDFSIDALVIKDGRFTYDNFNRPPTDFGMDYFHLTIDNLSGKFSEITIEDTLQARVTDLRAREARSDTRLHNLDGLITYASTFWEFDELDLKVNKSNLQHYVRFDYSRFHDFTSFIDSVTVTADLENSLVYSNDIAVFAPQLREYDENLFVSSAELKGKVKNFTARDVDVRYGQNTHIVGNFSADGLPNAKETFANIRLRESTINADDIRQFLPDNIYEVAERLGTVTLQGRFLGFYDDFVANGTFNTALGNLTSDINLKLEDEARKSSYKGYLKTNSFHLGRLIGNSDYVKTISMEGRVSGSGFSLQTARLNLDATIGQLHVLDYNYRNIKVDGTLSRELFSGKLAINDPNLVFSGNGDVSFGKGTEAFNLAADLQRVNLQGLGLSQKPLVIHADADLNFKGLKFDDFAGTALFNNATIQYNGDTLVMDSVLVESQITGGTRSLNLLSDLLTLSASGDFKYSVLFKDVSQLVKEYKLNFESIDAATEAYYRRKRITGQQDYSLKYDIYLKQVNPLLHMVVPNLSISDSSEVEGSFRHGNTVIFDLFAQIDTIWYDKITLYQNNVEINSSKYQQSPDVLASALFTSQKQLLPSTGETENFYVEGIWNERTIDFSTSISQPAQNHRASITGDINFLENQVQVVFDKSNITLHENPWAFTPGNTVLISEGGQRIEFINFALTNAQQVFTAQGVISDDPEGRLLVNVRNFDLRNLNPLLTQQISGTLHAEVVVQDVYKDMIFNTDMRIDSLYFDDVLIGNVRGRSNWLNAQQQLAVDVGINRAGKKVLTVTGNYQPKEVEEQLDLLAVMVDTQLKIVEPLLKPILSRMEGTMEGRLRILGRLSAPVLTGSVMVNSGQFRFDYLGVTYRFNDRVYFGANSISFRNSRLTDLFGNTGNLTGGITHDGFSNMKLDLEARFRNMMVLNTTSSQNELYYGTAFATGSASVRGPVDDLQINVNARSNENTRIVVPLDNQTELARKDFIKFVNRNAADTTAVAVKVEEPRVDLSGIAMNFNLDVTDEAYFEIIIDRQTGDVIRGSGHGQIRMTIDTRGDFNMYGNFEISNGAYNLNLLEGLVTREFKVTPGGTISWNGDPLAGTMRINATYTQLTSFSDLSLGTGGNQIQGRYPVTATIALTGPILTPEIKLGLNFDELPQDVQPLLYPILSSVRNDENELNRQVFSLLVLQRLAPPGSFATMDAGSAAVGGSLGSLLSSQLSSFFNSIDSNLQIDIGLGGVNQEALTNLQVRLSYNLFEGRLRVTGQSGIVTGTGNTTATGRNNRNAYQGDWSVEYYITKSGELRARLEYNTNPSVFNDRVNTSQSISLLHTKRFDTLHELFRRNKPSRSQLRKQQEEEPIILDSDPRLNL
uniref:translocation/assembly module TamB domain-containing protein n=1 Tax=Botryobacter ruber TaxID=2171629 RepID=UPI000FEC3C81|nr:translocation/assembly module TamB domain-containing protein [Botryobacter ruber]